MEHVLMIHGRFLSSNKEFYLFNVYVLCDDAAKTLSWDSLYVSFEACAGKHTSFSQSEHVTNLIECRKRVALENQSGNIAVSFWKTRYQLKDKTMINNKRTVISQLVREHPKTLTIRRDIRKILHVSVREFFLMSDNPSIIVFLKNVSQTIPVFHSSGVWFHNDGQQVSGDCGVYPLKDNGVKGGPLLILGNRGICWCVFSL
jgi:hypothetical protein